MWNFALLKLLGKCRCASIERICPWVAVWSTPNPSKQPTGTVASDPSYWLRPDTGISGQMQNAFAKYGLVSCKNSSGTPAGQLHHRPFCYLAGYHYWHECPAVLAGLLPVYPPTNQPTHTTMPHARPGGSGLARAACHACTFSRPSGRRAPMSFGCLICQDWRCTAEPY